MTTDELIRALRQNPAWGEQGDLMIEAANRLEELDERVAIMEESNLARWVKHKYLVNRWYCSRCGRMAGLDDIKLKCCPTCKAIMTEVNNATN